LFFVRTPVSYIFSKSGYIKQNDLTLNRTFTLFLLHNKLSKLKMLRSKLNGYLRILWKKLGINYMFNHCQKSNQNNQENKREELSNRLLPQGVDYHNREEIPKGLPQHHHTEEISSRLLQLREREKEGERENLERAPKMETWRESCKEPTFLS
jgi:transcriptional/translational regulatory protein YebC/TACO1